MKGSGVETHPLCKIPSSPLRVGSPASPFGRGGASMASLGCWSRQIPCGGRCGRAEVDLDAHGAGMGLAESRADVKHAMSLSQRRSGSRQGGKHSMRSPGYFTPYNGGSQSLIMK